MGEEIRMGSAAHAAVGLSWGRQGPACSRLEGRTRACAAADACVSGTLGSEAGHSWCLLAPGGAGVRVCLPKELSRGLEQNAEGLGQWIRRMEGGTGQGEMTPTIQEVAVPGNEL